MRLDESYEVVKHAKPVRCPRCRRPAPAFLFDSRATGMVCARCHADLMDTRKEEAVLVRRSKAEAGSTSPT